MKKLYKIRLTVSFLIFILAIFSVLGIFYKIKIFNIQLIPAQKQVLIDFSAAAVITLFILIISALIFGRIYCSIICPLGIFQELISFFRGKNKESSRLNLPVKYFIAAAAVGVLAGGSSIIIRYIEPYTFFASAVTLSITGITALAAITLLTLFKNRYFCTNICPVGCILGLISKFSLLKIYIDKNECVSCSMCGKNCPSGCINTDKQSVDNELCVKCLKCTAICRKQAIKYGMEPKKEVKFNIKRRETITFLAAFTVFLGAVKSGIDLSINSAKKIKYIILPPGSVSEQRLFNKCLNCNLCINACPNKIIKKANKDYGAIHIEYTNRDYCKYDCNECSKVCPSGAIKKLSLEEKQNTKIALAVVNKEKCIKCGSCIFECPKKAITWDEDNKAVIDNSKCIGCSMCKRVCSTDAIEIFAVNEQRVL